MEQRQTTSLKINKALWIRIKILCLKKEISISDWIEGKIKQELKIK